MTGANRLFEVLNDADGFEGARDDLGGPDAVGLVAELVFEQLRVSQDDAELVVQPVKQAHDFWSHGLGRAR